MMRLAAATVACLLALGTSAANAVCSTTQVEGFWYLTGSVAGGYCRVRFSREGVVPRTQCVNEHGGPGGVVSARITLDGACRLSGSLTFDGVRFSVVGRTDSDVHLFNGVAISPAGNFGISGSHL